jgi:TRAP-type uncharacterized transport system substrate-binding protein
MRTLLLLSMLVATAHAAPTLRLCTGTVGNHYHALGQRVAKSLEGTVAVEVIATRGSWDNLERIDTEPPRCDAIFAQDDAWALYQFEKPKSALMMDRIAVAYPEYVHLLCNAKAKITSASQLDAAVHTMVLNGFGSGTYITWGLMARLNPRFKGIGTLTETPEKALRMVAADKAPMCLLMVTATGGRTLTKADQTHGKSLSLVALGEEGLHRRVGRDRRAVYRSATIPAGTYTQLATDAVATQQVDAVFFVNPEWRARYPQAAKALAAAVQAR